MTSKNKDSSVITDKASKKIKKAISTEKEGKKEKIFKKETKKSEDKL